jgi:hypothetical protein
MKKSLGKILLLSFVLVLITTCKKDDDKCSIDINGLVFIDNAGYTIATCGLDIQDDWKFTGSWSSCVENLFKDMNLDSLSDFHATSDTPKVIVSPIPFNDFFAVHIQTYSSDTALLTLKIVDNGLNVLLSISKRVSSQFVFIVNVSNINLAYKKYYRMYYSLSYKNAANKYKGYGDVVRADNFSINDLFEGFCNQLVH